MGGRATDDVHGGDGTDTCEGETEVDCELDPSTAGALETWSSRSTTRRWDPWRWREGLAR
jgi:hypothetical protein